MSRRGGARIEPEEVAAAIDRATRASRCSGIEARPSFHAGDGKSEDEPSADLVDGWFAGRLRDARPDRDGSPESAVLAAFDGPRFAFLAGASLLDEHHPVARAIRRGIDGLREEFGAKAAEAGAR